MMFIKIGDRRINISVIKEYRPFKKPSSSGEYYSIEFVFLDDTKEEIYFFDGGEERDEYIRILDKNFLLNFS